MKFKSNWPTQKTGELFDLINGYAFKGKEFVDEGIPVLKIKNVKAGLLKLDNLEYVDESYLESRPDKLVQKNDLLITMSGNRHDGSMDTWVGKVCWFDSDSPFIVNQRVGILRLKADVKSNSRFLAYQLSSDEFQRHFISIATSSGGQANLSPSQINETELTLPPLQVQTKIVSIAGGLEDKISLNNQINQTLEQMAQALFKSWFVDFEPVKAKIAALEAGGSEEDANLAAMQAISGKTAAELEQLKAQNPENYQQLHTTAQHFPAAMQDSELGEIPEGWKVSEIGKEVTVVGGGTPPTKNPNYWEGGGIHWTTPKDLSGLPDKVLLETDRKITEAGLQRISSGLLPIDTVLMSSRAPVGYLALAKVPVAVNQGYIAMKCEQKLTPEYALQWCHANMEEIKSRASGTTFAEISKSNFNIIPLVVPSKSVLHEYSKNISCIYREVEGNIKEQNILADLRDELLPKLLGGELCIDNS